MPQTTVSEKFQVVIPKEIRQEVPLVAGQVVQVIAKNGVITLIPDRPLSTLNGFAREMKNEPVRVADPALLLRPSRLYHHDITPTELYEITRGVWRLGPRRQRAQLALAVFKGVVREVYTIQSWHPAGSTPYLTRDRAEVDKTGRWEFIGQKAPDSIRARYLNRSVASYFARGQQNPVVYANC